MTVPRDRSGMPVETICSAGVGSSDPPEPGEATVADVPGSTPAQLPDPDFDALARPPGIDRAPHSDALRQRARSCLRHHPWIEPSPTKGDTPEIVAPTQSIR